MSRNYTMLNSTINRISTQGRVDLHLNETNFSSFQEYKKQRERGERHVNFSKKINFFFLQPFRTDSILAERVGIERLGRFEGDIEEGWEATAGIGVVFREKETKGRPVRWSTSDVNLHWTKWGAMGHSSPKLIASQRLTVSLRASCLTGAPLSLFSHSNPFHSPSIIFSFSSRLFLFLSRSHPSYLYNTWHLSNDIRLYVLKVAK